MTTLDGLCCLNIYVQGKHSLEIPISPGLCSSLASKAINANLSSFGIPLLSKVAMFVSFHLCPDFTV
jgi:hypothetical protein